MEKSKIKQIIKEEVRKILNEVKYIEDILKEEEYTTTQGLKFKLKWIGFSNKNEKYYYYSCVRVSYKGKELIGGDGIPGGRDERESMNKAKKWLDKNGKEVIQGKKYRIAST